MVYCLPAVLEWNLSDIWDPSGSKLVNVLTCAASFPQKSAVFAPSAIIALGRIMAHAGESWQQRPVAGDKVAGVKVRWRWHVVGVH